MNENPFRKRPFVDVGIDSLKMAVIAITFLILALWAMVRFL